MWSNNTILSNNHFNWEVGLVIFGRTHLRKFNNTLELNPFTTIQPDNCFAVVQQVNGLDDYKEYQEYANQCRYTV